MNMNVLVFFIAIHKMLKELHGIQTKRYMCVTFKSKVEHVHFSPFVLIPFTIPTDEKVA